MTGKRNILLYIETSGPGGAERVLLNIARGIDKIRYEPFVILHKSRWLREQLLKYDIHTEIIPSQRSWNISFLFKLIQYCRKHKIGLIHSHLFGANLYACIAAGILRIPIVATFHNELLLHGKSEKYLSLKSFFIRRFASKIVFVADFMKDDYINKVRFPGKKALTIYNGLDMDLATNDLDISALKAELCVNESDLLVGHIANFRVPKGHKFLIAAAGLVCKELKNVKFLLIGDEGDGSLKGEIQDLIIKMDLTDNIRLLGFRDDIPKLLNLMDVFVLSSISEGLPLSVIEAMSASKPVVATDVGGLPEIVIPGKTGYLVKAGNADALAEKLAILLNDQPLREQMGNQGRKAVEKKFSLDAMIEKYQELYAELLK
ncbi:MAG: glycosyltransferase family 4 protein [Candidatus Zixiibacteriota bacterium]|nr:MAG: glycosyltransferase family 4 protein [candidate division Zixibacteria bacterium]